MKTTFVSKENDKVTFTMEFTAEEFEQAQAGAYQATKNKFAIDGFRKGKAPRSIIEKHYGEGVFFEDAINNMFADHYPAAIKELDIEVIDRPEASFSEIAKGKEFTVTITVPVYPEIEVKDYMGVALEKVSDEVKEEDVQKDIEALQKRNARIITVERAAKSGDTVVLDYAGFVGEDQFQGGTAEGQELKLGSGTFIPGFEDQLIGVAAGESKDVVVTFPTEYGAEDLAGKEAVFKCTVHEVKEEELPALDDEFAKDVSEFDTMEELKTSIVEKLEKIAKETAQNSMKDALIEKVMEKNPVDPPRAMVEDEIDRILYDLENQLKYQGLGLEQYLQFTQKDMNGFREELREEATKKVSSRLVLMAIVKKEDIVATDEDMNKEFENIAEQYKTTAEEVKTMLGDENTDLFKKDIQIKKVIDFLFENAKVK